MGIRQGYIWVKHLDLRIMQGLGLEDSHPLPITEDQMVDRK